MRRDQILFPILGLLLLAACTSACYNSKDYSPTAPGSVDDAFTLDAEPKSIPADGSSLLTLRATVRPVAGQEVIFLADRGKFQGATAATPSAPTTITVPVDSLGVSEAFLISDRQAGQVQVTASVKGHEAVLRRQIVTFTALDPGQVLSAQVGCPFLVADGVSRCPIDAKVDPAFAAVQTQPVQVQFSTTAGRFEGGATTDPTSVTQQIDGAYRATASLLADRAGSALVTLRVGGVGGVSASARVDLRPAAPQGHIEVVPDKFTITGAEWLPVSAQLSRSVGMGTVSQGTRIRVAVHKVSDGSALSFSVRNVMASNPTGLASFEVSRGATGFEGRCKIIVSVDGTEAVGSVVVEAKN